MLFRSTRGGKNYYVTFIDDYSRYAKVYLVRNKDEAYNMFLLYKAEVKNQLNKKIKRIRSNRGGELDQIENVSMFYLMIILKMKQ